MVLTRPVKIKKTCMTWDPCEENLRFRPLSPKGFVIRTVLCHISYFHSFLFGTQGVPREGWLTGSLEYSHSKQQTCHQLPVATSDSIAPENQLRGLFLHCTLIRNQQIRGDEGGNIYFLSLSSLRSFLPFCQKPRGSTSVRSQWQKSPNNQNVFLYLCHLTCNSTAFLSASASTHS